MIEDLMSQRLNRARAAVLAHDASTLEKISAADMQDGFVDLMADITHLAFSLGLNTEVIGGLADMHFHHELQEHQPCLAS